MVVVEIVVVSPNLIQVMNCSRSNLQQWGRPNLVYATAFHILVVDYNVVVVEVVAINGYGSRRNSSSFICSSGVSKSNTSSEL